MSSASELQKAREFMQKLNSEANSMTVGNAQAAALLAIAQGIIALTEAVREGNKK